MINTFELDFLNCKLSLDEKINLRYSVVDFKFYNQGGYINQDWLSNDQVLFNRLIGETAYINWSGVR